MTEYEALACEILKGKVDNITDEGWQIVVEALKKQIPKPVDWCKDISMAVCPVCGSFLTHEFYENADRISWCDGCGQRLLWRDNK